MPRVPLPLTGPEHPEVPLYDPANLGADLRTVGRNRLAEKVTGGLSSPGKMPCFGWGISAARCRIGSLLAEEPGTVCSDCYARKRNYARQNVQDKLEQRYRLLFDERNLWTPGMIFLISYFCDRYFRFFDSGDIQGANHLKNIVTIAENVPDVRIWLPTRETETVRRVLEEIGAFPENLAVRISGNKIDGKSPKGFEYTSTVVSNAEDASCPAQRQHNRCDGEVASCRACWHEPHVSYPWH